jgi:BirA family biotin operon repressor/biotin-[acetyl-CoA-carboxylase] ligase
VSSRARVLAGLKRSDAGVSGEALARELGISRTAVAKHIAALRELGYGIEAHPGSGYRLVSAPSLCIPEEVEPLVTHPMLGSMVGGVVTASTNDDARGLAMQGAREGTVVVAASQSAGRGRFDRPWSSAPGGVYLSLVLRPPMAPSELAPLPLVLAVGVAQGLESLGAAPHLKWPNDILLSGRKVAGILLEMSGQADRVDWVVVGVGVNVTASPSDVHPAVASLSEQVGEPTPALVAAAVLDGMAAVYERWRGEGFSGLREEFVRRDDYAGREVFVSAPDGRIVGSGRTAGIDEIGRIRVEDASGVRAFASGEVSLRRRDTAGAGERD